MAMTTDKTKKKHKKKKKPTKVDDDVKQKADAKKVKDSEPTYEIGVPSDKRLVHPAQHFDRDRGAASFGFVLPLIKRGKDKDGNEINSSSDTPMLVYYDQKPVPCMASWLSNVGITLAAQPEWHDSTENRISHDLLGALVRGETEKAESLVHDGAEVFVETVRLFRSLWYIPEDEWYDFVALWTIGTYCFTIFDTYPQVFWWGPRGSAKSKCMKIVEKIGFNAELTPNLSGSSLFRTIEALLPALLLDEMEKIADKEKFYEIRSMLLSGYKRGAKVKRTEPVGTGGKMKQVRFQVYSPKMIANIDGIDQTLQDRCITITTQKLSGGRLSPELRRIVNREVDTRARNPIYQKLRDSYYILIYKFWLRIDQILQEHEESEEEEQIAARHLEMWRPIIVLARFFEEIGVDGLEARIRGLIDSVISQYEQAESDSNEHTLIRALYSLVYDYRADDAVWIPNGEIRDEWARIIAGTLDASTIEPPRWMSPRFVGTMLKGRLRFTSDERKRTGKSGSWHVLLSKKRINELIEHFGVDVSSIVEAKGAFTQMKIDDSDTPLLQRSDGPEHSEHSVEKASEHTEHSGQSEHSLSMVDKKKLSPVLRKLVTLWEEIGVGIDKSVQQTAKNLDILKKGHKEKLVVERRLERNSWWALTPEAKDEIRKAMR